MKKDFIVTTNLADTWEFYENNFILGSWCEFNEVNDLDKDKTTEKINTIKNPNHWKDCEKRVKDYEYLKKKLEYLLEIISEKLSRIHNLNENKEYWRIVVYNWLNQYVVTIFDRWEHVRIFFEKNKDKKFYSNFISLNDSDFVPKNHQHFIDISQYEEWNHLIFLRLFRFLNIENLLLIKKKDKGNNLKKREIFFSTEDIPLIDRVTYFYDSIISKFAFKFNKIILENFYFPKKEYLQICLRCKLIPSKYRNFFNFDIKENGLPKDNKRIEFKNLLLEIDSQDKFIKFLLSSLHKDIPKSYLENFGKIKKKILPFAKEKKIIFSMYSLFVDDNFKIYIAETKKVGSKLIHAPHGGGLTSKVNSFFGFFEKTSDKVVILGKNSFEYWDDKIKKNIFAQLGPTFPIIKFKKKKAGNFCSIVYVEQRRYLMKFPMGPLFDQSNDFFNELTQLVNTLNPEIKSKVKFRVKRDDKDTASNLEKKFSKIFGEKYIDTISIKNSFKKTILNSKLIIATYPQTAFSEAIYSNVPTMLIIKKNHWQFNEVSLNTLEVLKKNKIAFDDFNEAKNHINKYWNDLDSWWKNENVQSARKMYLTNFFNVKSNWFKEWSDYIYFSQKL